ncbi:MAG: hypothetical protein OXH65_09475 [Paracoccaceae bacterium]|nr:hypothetical protein [Paracoccaceae bacterium]MYJ86824.1 hypothetical protein [Paracoccaceae bacterium]
MKAEYVDIENYPNEMELTAVASKVFQKRIESKFNTKFKEVNVDPGAELPAFVTALTSSNIPLITGLLVVFFSGKPILVNLDAWSNIFEKIRPYFNRKTMLNRNGATTLAVKTVIEDMGGILKKIVLWVYRPLYRSEEVGDISPPQSIEDTPPTLDLSMVNHVFQIEVDGILFLVTVNGAKVVANRL